jgi:hypothetical protein
MTKFTYHIIQDKFINKRVHGTLVYNFITQCTVIQNKYETEYLSQIQAYSITSIPTWTVSTEREIF